MMEHFTSLAFIGLLGFVGLLLWQLYTATQKLVETQTGLFSAHEELQRIHQAHTTLTYTHNLEREQLTCKNQELSQQAEILQTNLYRLKADHFALQDKSSQLEQELLTRIRAVSTLNQDVQASRLEQSKLKRQLEIKQQITETLEVNNQSLSTQVSQHLNKLQMFQQALQVAKTKIETLEHQKKQLERELQQALHQIVELEESHKIPAQLDYSDSHRALAKQISLGTEPLLPKFNA